MTGNSLVFQSRHQRHLAMNSIPGMLFGTLCLLCTPCFAGSHDYGEGLQNLSSSRVLDNGNGSHDHWQGIGRLAINQGSCTASLIDTRDETASEPTPAYVLTAGHCVELSNGNIVTDSPFSGTMDFNYFADVSTFKRYPLKTVTWRSMQGVDMAIIELDASIQKLIEEGIQPLKLARDIPPYDTDMLIVGAPKGFDQITLRMAACTLQPAKEIVEGAWVWRNTFMTRCQDVRGGGSGSPVLERYTNEIIGVIGTGNFEEGIVPCLDNAPCTPIGDTFQAVPGNVYGNATTLLNGCFLQGRIATNPPSSCQLYPTFTIEGTNNPESYKRPERRDDSSLVVPTWNYRFSISTAFYRYKTVRNAMECESTQHYSDAISATDAFINAQIGTTPGFYFLCIVGVDSVTQRPEAGLLKNALSLPIEILDNKPTTPPDLSIEAEVFVKLAEAEAPYRTYSIKYGPVETTDCHAPDKYIENMPMDFFIANDKLPGKLCVIAYDKSGQASEPRIDVFNRVTGAQQATSADADAAR
jgi:hypothetical protein